VNHAFELVASGAHATVSTSNSEGEGTRICIKSNQTDLMSIVKAGDRITLVCSDCMLITSVKSVVGAAELQTVDILPTVEIRAWLIERLRVAALAQPRPASPDFAPANPTDNRSLFDFKSRWPEDAKRAQRREGYYLATLWIAGISGVFGMLIATDVAKTPVITTSMPIVFCAGLVGGTTFDVKWWYHTIARGIWNLDRAAWRVAVPWVSAVVSMFVHVLFKSDLLGILNPVALDNIHNMLALGFLVGYFSDSAIAKMAEIAESLFGTSRGRDKVTK
jgi:hypothetical protein